MLFFIHIPKTAGTSVRHALERALGDRIVPVYGGARPEWDPDAVAQRDLRDDGILYGHFTWGYHDKLRRPPCYATILREPVERVISWYNFMASAKERAFHAEIESGASLRSIVERGTHDVSNRMVGMIAGRTPKSLDDAETLRLAETHLQSFEFVSVQSMLHLEQDRLSQLSSGVCGPIPRANVSAFKAEVDEATLEAIRRHNALDLELYSAALRLTQAQQQEFARNAPRVGLAAW